MSDSVRHYGQQPTRLLCPRDCLGKNTGVGCHSLLHDDILSEYKNFSDKISLYFYIHILWKGPRSVCFKVCKSCYLFGWTALTPSCQLYLRPAALFSPLSMWLNFSLLPGLCPSQISSVNSSSCLRPIWKLEECLLLMQMVNSHEPPGRRKTPGSQQYGFTFP